MKFTWWTYFVAIRRSLRAERLLYAEYLRAFRGPEAWHDQFRLTCALMQRDRREH